jgi:hypothetical protein
MSIRFGLKPGCDTTLRPEMFKPASVDEDKIRNLVTHHILPPHSILQWQMAKGEEIPTLNTNEIVMSKAFFHQGYGLPNCDFFHGLLHHFKIELVHLNHFFVHLCEVYLTIPPIFTNFKYYFFLKYQLSVANCQIIDGAYVQAHANRNFLTLPSIPL